MLLAWEEDGAGRKLVGIWALRLRKFAPLWPVVLDALPFDYAFLSSPIVDPAYADAVIAAFFSAIEKSTLPNVLSLPSLDAEGPVYAAILMALAKRGTEPLVLSELSRPYVTREFGVKRTGSTRKKLRQDWNRLSALGTVEIVNDRTPAGVAQAFEAFLALEKASWKGERGTALLSNAGDAAFVRRLIHDLAERQAASVAELQLNGEVIAAQVLMYCGDTAYTWKTAFDAAYAKHSPGTLLVDKITDELLAERRHQGDQFLRRRIKLHGPALVRAPRHGGYAGRYRTRKIARLSNRSPAADRLSASARSARQAA